MHLEWWSSMVFNIFLCCKTHRKSHVKNYHMPGMEWSINSNMRVVMITVVGVLTEMVMLMGDVRIPQMSPGLWAIPRPLACIAVPASWHQRGSPSDSKQEWCHRTCNCAYLREKSSVDLSALLLVISDWQCTNWAGDTIFSEVHDFGRSFTSRLWS